MVTEREAYDHSSAVFTGTVAEKRQSDRELRILFAVDRVYEGAVTANQTIVTSAYGASCGLALQGPGPYLVFATSPDGLSDVDLDEGEFWSGLCSGTRPLASSPVPVSFGEGTDPLPGGATLGGDESWTRFAPVAVGLAVVVIGTVGLVRWWLRRAGGGPQTTPRGT